MSTPGYFFALGDSFLQEELGYRVELVRLEADRMWQSVADGDVDAMLSAWLPVTHAHYFDRFGDSLVDLGPNLRGARIGLVVPDVGAGRQVGAHGKRARSYITAQSIGALKDCAPEFHRRIIGIEPAAGIMSRAKQAMEAYGLEEYMLIDGSEISMTAELSNAIRHKRWIVVTGWTPHWMFARWNLRFLDDPLKIFGGAEEIHTIVRPGLREQHPEVYQVLDAFSWTIEESSQLMIWNENDHGLYPYENALRWIRTNRERIESWLEESGLDN